MQDIQRKLGLYLRKELISEIKNQKKSTPTNPKLSLNDKVILSLINEFFKKKQIAESQIILEKETEIILKNSEEIRDYFESKVSFSGSFCQETSFLEQILEQIQRKKIEKKSRGDMTEPEKKIDHFSQIEYLLQVERKNMKKDILEEYERKNKQMKEEHEKKFDQKIEEQLRKKEDELLEFKRKLDEASRRKSK